MLFISWDFGDMWHIWPNDRNKFNLKETRQWSQMQGNVLSLVQSGNNISKHGTKSWVVCTVTKRLIVVLCCQKTFFYMAFSSRRLLLCGVTRIQSLLRGIEPAILLTKGCGTWINVKVISSWDLLRHEKCGCHWGCASRYHMFCVNWLRQDDPFLVEKCVP